MVFIYQVFALGGLKLVDHFIQVIANKGNFDEKLLVENLLDDERGVVHVGDSCNYTIKRVKTLRTIKLFTNLT